MDESISSQRDWRHPVFRGVERQGFAKVGGFWFGLIFGFSYSLILWGRHIYVLEQNAAIIPWLEVVFGFILCGGVWAYASVLASRSSVRRSVIITSIAGFVTPWLVWFSKFLDENWIRFFSGGDWEYVIRSGEALRSRLGFIGFWGIGIGAFAGLLERILLPRAWDLTSASGRMTLRSLGILLLSLPLTLLYGNVSNDMLHRDLQEALMGTYQGLVSMDDQDTRRPFLTWGFGDKRVVRNSSWDWPSGDFSIYLADYDPESMGQYFFDAVFTDGNLVRCMGGSASMQLCGDVRDTLRQMMDEIIAHAVSLNLDEIRCEACDPYLKPQVATWLATFRSNFTDTYEISRETRYGGAIPMVARFDTGYVLRCHFFGENPIVVENCEGEQTP